MDYKNINDILPKKLVNEIQNYIQGQYVYIPKRIENKLEWGSNTNFRREIGLRNVRIYEKHLEGESIRNIAGMFKLSEKSIRRIVKLMSKDEEGEKLRVKKLLKENWNLVGDIKPIYTNVWEIEGRYVAKKYFNTEELQRNVEILQILHNENIPVPQIIKTTNNKMYGEMNDVKVLVTSKLEGSNIVDTGKCTAEWYFYVGEIIAKLHNAFFKCQTKIDCWYNSLLGEMKSWIYESLKASDFQLISEKQYMETLQKLEQNYDKLSEQLIHRDVHLGNFLFCEKRFSGYLDFDLSQINIRIFDICYFLLGLLTEDSYKLDKEEWLIAVNEVTKGYCSINKLSFDEKTEIVYVMESIEILFVAWFINEGDSQQADESKRIYNFIRTNRNDIIANV